MAKPTGGLLAFSARGTVAKTITFASWRGRQYVRQHVIPANPRSLAQTETRDAFSYLSASWKLLPGPFQASWTLAAKGNPITDRNLWVKANLALLRGAVDNNAMTFGAGAKGGLPVGSHTVTPGVAQVTYAAVPPTLPTGWTVTALHVAVTLREVASATQAIVWFYGTDPTSPYSVNITGLTSGTAYVIGGMFQYVKPDGTVAYGPAAMDLFTSL